MADRALDNYHHLQLPETERWGLVLRKDDPLAQKEAIAPSDLLGLPLLLSEQAVEEHRFQKWWGNLEKKLQIIGTYTLVFNAQLMVKQGQAYVLSFDDLIDNSNQSELTFRPLTPQLTETTSVIWKKNIIRSKVAELFIKRLSASLAD